MEKRKVYVGINGGLYSSPAEVRKYGDKPLAKGNPGRVPIEVDERGRIRYPDYLGRNGKIYSSSAEAERYGAKPTKRKSNDDRVPIEVDEQGNVREIPNPIFIGEDGEIYTSIAEAKNYKSKSSKKVQDDRVPVEVGEDGSVREVPEGGLVTTLGTASVMGLIGGIFVIGFGATGNAIANLSNTTSNFVGTSLFLLGIVAGLFYLDGKK